MKKLIALLLAFAMVLTLAGCNTSIKGNAVTLAAEAVYPEPFKKDDFETQWNYWEENRVSEDFLTSFNDFGWKTTAQLLKNQPSGTLYSPISLYYALALTAAGAEGDTAAQLYDLLGSDRDTVTEESGKLFRFLYHDDKNSVLTIANSIWMDSEVQGIPITYAEDYKKTAVDDYYSSLFTADFASKETGKAIEKWISDATRGKLSYAPEVSDDAMMAIINTIYLKAAWQDEFSKITTRKETFTRADGTEEQTDFMHQTTEAYFHRGEGYTAASLPLRGNGVREVVFVLPDEGVTVDDILNGDDPFQSFRTAADSYEDWDKCWWEIAWSVPKFEYDSKLDMVEALKALGVTDAFVSDVADFSRMSDAPAPFISKVLQGTHIGMDEEGVEAAAYTVIGLECGAAAPMNLEQVEMNLNRPFLYSIIGGNGATLFTGTYTGK